MKLRIRRGDVTLVSNRVINECRLSFGALGLLTHLLSMKDGDEVADDTLSFNGHCGLDDLELMKDELRKARLLIRRPDGNEDVYDEPMGAQWES